MKKHEIVLPYFGDLTEIKAGDIVSVSGVIYTARDAAHKRMVESGDLPIDLAGSAIYYCGPTPKKPNEIIGSCGPTTSGRMDDYTPFLLERGLAIMIGKGKRSQAVIDSMVRNKAIYLLAIGGAGAYMKSKVTACEVVAYSDLGCEAIHRLTVKDMELIVGIDASGKSVLL